jgi:hypothetical protein
MTSAIPDGVRFEQTLTLPETRSPHAGAVLASGLRHSRMFDIAVDVYRRHRPDDSGRCGLCSMRDCRVHLNAAKIIEAANENPDAFEVDAVQGEGRGVVRPRTRWFQHPSQDFSVVKSGPLIRPVTG